MDRSAEAEAEAVRVGVILAGGQSRRMGSDKARIELAGRPLIEHVLGRLAPQVELTLISGRSDYGTGRVVIGDRPDGPKGPAAGLWATAHWLKTHCPKARLFVAVPVDGPFLPIDLYDRMAAAGPCAVAVTEDGQTVSQHPTFGLWPVANILKILMGKGATKGPSLHHLVQACAAREVIFATHQLLNINTPNDLVQASALIRDGA